MLAPLAFIFTFCQKERDCCSPIPPLPNCINEMIADTSISNHLISIQMTSVGKEKHFWLNTGASHYDGPEYIVNEQCDTVCYWLCYCKLPACAEAYSLNNFVVVWEP